MGQYYVMVNLDKQELLCPDAFGDGPKLLEFGSSSNGMLQAFAMLTATGNGDGNGDICRTAHSTQGKIYEPRTGERIHYERQQDYDHNHKQLPDGQTCGFRIMVPGLSGRWAGDRIVTAGDYTPPGKFLTKAQHLEGLRLALENRARYVRDNYKREPTDEDFEGVTANLYHYACARFTDISELAKEQLLLFEVGRGTDENFAQIVTGMLERSLVRDFGTMVKVGKGKRVRYKYDLTWMAAECIDSFLCRTDTAADMARAKKWLKDQVMLPWQLELIKLYRGGERPTHRQVVDVLVKHKVNMHVERSEQQQRLLPTRPYLNAALALEGAVATGSTDAVPVLDTTQLAIADAAGIHVRNRVILID